jgi:hypothetical protein
MTIDPHAVFETTWWEHVLDAEGKPKMSGFDKDGVSSPIMRETTTGREVRWNEMPTGALWSARRTNGAGPNSYPRVGYDGLSIYCKHADGHSWAIEGRASNCTMKEDHEHRCWVRHGTVGEKITVDKNGKTCAAGAGSFFMGSNNEWHGFLRDGKLTP